MLRILLFLALSLAYWPLNAAAQFKVLGEAAMKWPGIHYEIFWLQRIPPDRLLVGIRMVATAQAPAAGTLVGYPVSVPPGLSPEQIALGDYRPQPFSLASSVMVDDVSKQQYETLAPISPAGKVYYPDHGSGFLTTGKALIFSIQFKVPPPPPPEPGQPAVKQTLSFSLTNAKDAIQHIPIPPPLPAAK